MKKLLAILLTLSMLASFVALPTFADEAAGETVVEETTGESDTNQPYTIDGISVCSQVAGEGFYDANNAAYDDVFVDGVAKLDSTDWAKYDLSGLENGKYKVTVKYSTDVYASSLSFMINDELVLSAPVTNVNGTEVGTDYYELELGHIYIGEGDDTIIVKNSGKSVGLSQKIVWIDYIKFELADGDGTGLPMYSLNAYDTIAHYNANNSQNRFESAEGQSSYGTNLRPNNSWNTYDISDFKAGTYKLSINYCARKVGPTLSVAVDGDTCLRDKAIASTGSLTTIGNQRIGYVYIGEDSETITLTNTGTDVLPIHYIDFEYVTDARRLDAYDATDHYNPNYSDNRLESAQSTLDSYSGTTLRVGSWNKYDISGFKAGTYKLSIKYALRNTDSTLSVEVDDVTCLDSKKVAKTGSGFTQIAECSLGYVYIPEDAKTITLKNPVSNVFSIHYIDFEYITDVRRLDAYEVKDHYNSNFTDNRLEKAQSTLDSYLGTTLRANSWNEYDISGFKKGTYKLSIFYGSKNVSSLSVKVNEDICFDSISAANTTDYAELKDLSLGYVYIDEDAQTITLTNTGAVALSIQYIDFKYIAEGKRIDPAIPFLVDGEIVEGTSFYDAGGESKFESSDGAVTIRQNDWVKYDLSGLNLAYGIYDVYGILSNSTSATASDVKISATNREVTTTIPGRNTTSKSWHLGKILVNETTDGLMVSLLTTNRIVVTDIIIKEAESSTEVTYSSDEEGANVISSLKGLESAYVTTSILRPKQAEIDETVYVALYDGASLKSATPIPVTTAYEFDNTFEVTGLAECTSPVIKTFVWKNTTQIPVISTEGTTISAQ